MASTNYFAHLTDLESSDLKSEKKVPSIKSVDSWRKSSNFNSEKKEQSLKSVDSWRNSSNFNSEKKVPYAKSVDSWRNSSKFKSVKPVNRSTKSNVPTSIEAQRLLREKYNYKYTELNNGNIENNSTFYVNTNVAHPHQVRQIFEDAITQAKSKPDIFGKDFECDVQVNHIRNFKNEYMGHGYVDVSNPKMYYALLGFNLDGSERAIYIDDPSWNPPPKQPKSEKIKTTSESTNWGDMLEDDDITPSPKIKSELPPLIVLSNFKYDEKQQEHFQTDKTHGSIAISPAFITPGVPEGSDDCTLYIGGVPAEDYDFLYKIFSRYARKDVFRVHDYIYYPKINIRKSNNGALYALVRYSDPYDTAFACVMLKKIMANYMDKDVTMIARYATPIRNK